MYTILLILLPNAILAVETYPEYVARSFEPAPGPRLAAALNEAGVPPATWADAASWAGANVAFLDSAYDGAALSLVRPSSDARVAVPLLVQLVREWSRHGFAQRAQAFLPLVEAMREAVTGRVGARLLVPGSGLGRLVHDLAEAFASPGALKEIVAVEHDVHAQLMARHMLEGGKSDGGGGDGSSDEWTACGGADVPGTAPGGVCVGGAAHGGRQAIYPSLHVATGWHNASDRIAACDVPDVSSARLAAVQERTSIALHVGTFPEALPASESGAVASAFDGAATAFFLDVVPDPLGAIRAMQRLLAPRQGTWANVGPLAFPDAPHEAMGGANAAHALSATQLLALVRLGGFVVRENRLVDCEYGGLPMRAERTLRQCLYFVAVPRGRGDHETSRRDE